jgi:hypothetical protein
MDLVVLRKDRVVLWRGLPEQLREELEIVTVVGMYPIVSSVLGLRFVLAVVD